MKVIFLKDVPRVGKRHDVKEVPDGYAMNFLFPRKFAQMATAKALTELEQHKNEIAIEREVQETLLLKNLEEIKGKAITISAKSDDKGHLFSAVKVRTIVDELKHQHHADVGEEFIILEKPIKEVGTFEIPIVIKGKKSFFKVIIENFK